MRYIKNLTDSQAAVLTLPPANYVLPNFDKKESYREWCVAPGTNHAFMTGYIGEVEGMRVSSSNPAAKCEAIIVDYDAKPPEDIGGSIKANAVAGLEPSYYCRSYSGHVRCIWVLSSPVLVYKGVWERVVKQFVRQAKVTKLLPGAQVEEIAKTSQTYEVGSRWEKVGATVDSDVFVAWIADAAEKIKWKDEGFAVPIPEVAKEVENRWPGRWKGEFALGSRGPLFWINDGVDRVGAKVVESGMLCFSERAGKLLVKWSELFGANWCKTKVDAAHGAAINCYSYEPNTGKYWVKDQGGWVGLSEQTVKLRLRVQHGVDDARDSDTSSPLDRALVAIQSTRAVSGVQPFIYRKEDFIKIDGETFINTNTVHVVEPEEADPAWGNGFPKLAAYFEGLFGKHNSVDGQLLYFVSWMAWAWKTAYEGNIKQGQAVYIAGPVGVGKTYLTQQVLGRLFGGYAVCDRLINGSDQFNRNAIAKGLWTSDDAESPESNRDAAKLEQSLKQLVANPVITVRGMYREVECVRWSGRIVITCNDDPESIRRLPCGERANADKFALFLAKKWDGEFPDEATICRELPYLANFLNHWEIPMDIRDIRFGVRSYHHPDLVSLATQNSDTTVMEEYLDDWQEWYFFSVMKGKQPVWEGTVNQLIQELLKHPDIEKTLLKNFPTANTLARALNKLINRGVPGIERIKSGNRRFYRIIQKNADIDMAF